MSGAECRFASAGERVVDAALAAGVADAEAYFHHGEELTARVFDAAVESLTSAESRGVGLRVFDGGRMGFAHTSDLSEPGLRRLVELAVDACRHNQPDEHNGLPTEMPDGQVDGLVADDFGALSVEERVAMALTLDGRVRTVTPSVRRSAGTTYADERGRSELYSSRGVRAAYESTVAYAYTEAIAEDSEEMQSGFSFTYGRSQSALDLDACAIESAERAAALLGSRPVSSRTTAVVFQPWAAASLVGALGSSISAEAVQKGRSLLAGRLGEAVAAPGVTLVDDGRMAEGLASRPWDGEGVPSLRTAVVEAGVLRSYLHTTYTARKDGSARSTGSASRSSYRAAPELSPSNLVLLPGRPSHQELLSLMGDGVLITDVHGLHTINPVTGEFSVGINGHLVENGTIGAPVREMTVAGTLQDLMRSIEAVGCDLRYLAGTAFVGAPSLLVRDLALSGS